jgi:hypothetical protein
MKNLTNLILTNIFIILAFTLQAQTPVSISVSETNDGGEVAREGRIFTYTYSNWGNACYAWGFDKTNANLGCINGNDQPTWNCADWFTTSSSISGNVAYLNTSTTVRYITTSGSYTNGTLSARLKFTATTTGGTPINFGQNGNIIFVPVTENFRIEVEIQLYGPGGAIWGTPANPGNYAFSWNSALNVFDALHTDPNYQIYTSYDNSETGFYTIPTSNTTPTITSPTCGSSTTSSSVTFWWTDPCTIHPESHYEWRRDGGSWIGNGTSNSEWESLNIGENTFQVRYYDGCNEQYYTSSICYIYRIDPDYCGDVDHGGNDWTISSNTTVAGRHYNVGTFTVNSGVTATVDASCHYFTVEAEDINVLGTIDANGAGESGGSGGAIGGFWAEGGYTDGRGITSCWDKDNCRALGQRGGFGGASGTGTGGGSAGNNGGTGYGSKQICGWFDDDGGVVGGGGGGGAGSGGSYGGAGGSGRSGGVGGEDDAQCGNAGCYGYSVGSGGSGGSSASTYGNANNENINWGSGGGGAGGGGRGAFCGSSTCYSDGNDGGSGGGAIKLIANSNLNCSGSIYANGTNGGNGGEGGENDYTEGCCNDFSPDCEEQTFCGPGGGGSGAGGGSGGGVMLKADCELNFTGTIQANGGSGGNGGDGGYSDWSSSYYGGKGSGGAGGGGGRVKFFTNPCSSNTISGSISVNGGNGGSVASFGRAGTGSNGIAGNSGTNTTNTSSSISALNQGNIGNNQSLCYNDPASNLISIADASGGSCATPLYQWMQCTSGCSSPPTNYSAIGGANSSTYNPGNLTQTTWFVRRVTTDNCTEYTSPVEIEMFNDAVAEGTWVGSTNTNWFECTNWGNGRVPISSMNVTIPSGCTYYPNINAAGAVCNRLTVQNGGSLTVSSGNLTVNEHFYKQNGGNATFSGGICNVQNNYYNYGTSGETRVNGGTLNIGTAATDREFRNYGGKLYVTAGNMDCGQYLYNYNGYTNNYVNISGGTVFADRIPNYEGVIYQSGGTLTSNGYYREYDAAGGNYYGSGSAVFNLNGNSYIRLMSSGSYFAHLNINGNYYITTDSNYDIDVNGDITIGVGQTLTMNNYDMNIAGNFTNHGNYIPGTGNINFNGSSPQTIKTNGDIFYDVSFNNTGSSTADLLLDDDMNITNSANFVDGIVFSISNAVIFANGATTNAGTASSFVDAEIIRTGSAAFTYPTGDVPNISGSPRPVWAPIRTDACASSTIIAQYFYENPPYDWWYHSNNMDPSIDHVTDREYWDLTTDNETPAVTLYWTDNTDDIHSFGATSGEMTPTFVANSLTIAHYNVDQHRWNDMGANVPTTIYFDDGQLKTIYPFPNYSPITFASKRPDFQLPVELVKFEAKCNEESGHVELTWETASETNNEYFLIERSTDALNFKQIGRIDGAGNSTEHNHYSLLDQNPPSGTIYYKLTQFDFDGRNETFNLQTTKCFEDDNMPSVQVYPNIVDRDISLLFENWVETNVQVELIDPLGKQISNWKIDVPQSDMHKQLSLPDLTPGLYLIKIKTKHNDWNFKIQKQ